MGRPVIDLTGQKFTRLTVVARAGLSNRREAMWLCQCDCGAETVVRGYRLRNGDTRSCGCLNPEAVAASSRRHGHASPKRRSGTYRSWEAMRRRTTNPSVAGWKNYGGRGIKCCERWASFENFLTDMGERPEGTSIDRIDPFGNYEPANCRWATAQQQRDNRRDAA